VARAAGQAENVLAVAADVSRLEDVESLKEKVYGAFGEVALLMNNAGTEGGGQMFGDLQRWRAILETNLWGVINGVHVFAPAMVGQNTPGAIVNTGSKQGITTPPGNTAYNVSKAGVKVFTEALAHDLRNTPDCQVSAHLLIPGFVYTGFTKARGITEKPAGAWAPEQVIDFLLPALERKDFYVLCPDNETTREMDEKRIRWAAEDLIENRPPLSRWHPDYKDAFAKVMEG
jgi:NAD(P)-dependent dehydrogenase (short-subunit alcohol dehydrogenase family)